MPQQDLETNPEVVTVARSTLYSLFAKALSHPSDEILAGLTSGQIETDIRTLMEEASYPAPHGQEEKITFSADDLEVAYASAFEAGLPKVSLREAHYIREGEKVLFEDLFRFYDHFGLDTSSGTLREWPDHIAVELEFMHYLIWLDAQPGSNKEALRLAQKDFLAHHLGHWTEPLAVRLKEKSAPQPWPHIAKLLADFVAAETDMLSAE